MQFTWKKCIIILVRNKYTTQRYKVKEIKTMTVNTRFGKITASKETLNDLCIALFEAADSIEERKGIKKRDVYGYDTVANQIFDALDGIGFYTK